MLYQRTCLCVSVCVCPHVCSQLLVDGEVELVEETEGQCPSVGHHAAWSRGVKGHLLSQ